MASNPDAVRKIQRADQFFGKKGRTAAIEWFAAAKKDKDAALKRHLNPFDLKWLYPTLIPAYEKELANINAATFTLMSNVEKAALKNRLISIYFTFYAQYLSDAWEAREYKLKGYIANMRLCQKLIDQLDLELNNPVDQNDPTRLLKTENLNSENYFKLFGFEIGKWFADNLYEFTSGETVTIKKVLGAINNRRLYWVWGGGMLNTILDAMPKDFFHQQQAQKALSAPSIVTGPMSWILYYFRFGINLTLLLKHTIAGPWMSKEERQIPAWERFKTQWEQRKFALLNDSIWATANLLTNLWLTGAGSLGYSGNVLTGALLLMDVCLNIWRFYEESTNHNKVMLELENSKLKLEQELSEALRADIKDEVLVAELKQRIAEVVRTQRKTSFDWKYQKYGLVNDLVYSIALLAAFSMMVCFFFPPAMIAPATILILGIAGAALSFALTVAYAAITGGLEIAKSKASAKMDKQDYMQLLKEFKELREELILVDGGSDSEKGKEIQRELKIKYLMMKDLEASVGYHQKMAKFQALKLVRSVFIDAFIPAFVFASFVFLPAAWIGIIVLVAGMLLAKLSEEILNKFEPEAAEKFSFTEENQNDYDNFLNEPDLYAATFAQETLEKEHYGLFSNRTEETYTRSGDEGEPLLNNEY